MTLSSRFLFLYVIFFLGAFQAGAQDDLFDIGHSTQFAHHLYTASKFDAAALEFERLALLDSVGKNDHRLMAIKSYRQGDHLAVGLKRFNQWFPEASTHNLALEREFSFYLIQSALYHDATSYIESANELPSDERNLMLTIAWAFMEKWPEARASLDKVTTTSKERALLDKVVEDGRNQKKYKPAKAALLSIIPGVGRLYTGNYIDASMSLLTIATLGWQSYLGFEKNGISSGYGWVLGTLAAGFYLGNIYGSYRAALLKNRLQKTRINADLNLALDMLD